MRTLIVVLAALALWGLGCVDCQTARRQAEDAQLRVERSCVLLEEPEVDQLSSVETLILDFQARYNEDRRQLDARLQALEQIAGLPTYDFGGRGE